MKGTHKTKNQLIDELNSLRQRITELEAAEAEHKRLVQDARVPQQILEKIVQILESAIDSMFIHDAEGNFIYVNEAAAWSNGSTKEELLKSIFRPLQVQMSSDLFDRHI